MRILYALFFIAALTACNANEQPENLKVKLQAAMQDYLYKSINYDSSKAKYAVTNVVYFEEKTSFTCEFTVLLKVAGRKDTIGTMGAFVSKDFATVTRRFW